MSVIIEKSVCVDCIGKDTCQRLKRLNPQSTIRDDLISSFKTDTLSCKHLESRGGRPKEIFELIIATCSMKKQCIERKRFNLHNVTNLLRYCKLCQTMHRETSKIGIAHKIHLG